MERGGRATFSLRQGSIYPDFELRDNNKGWERDWFMVSNLVPSLPACTGCTLEYKTCWEEPPTAKEMVQVERLLAEIAELIARNLTRAIVALSFCKRLTQPIQERVHLAYEYWGHHDPAQG